MTIGSNEGEAEEERADSPVIWRGGGMRQIFDEGFWKFGLGRGSIGMLERGMLEVDKAKVSLECGKAEE